MEKTTKYQDYLIESLKDPEEAVNYLNAAFEEGDAAEFLLALKNIVAARGDLTKQVNKYTVSGQ